ncbi:340_t:CDS:2 [Acaulospora morrowiae]|uniref:340_t:CDS:1 n=1 Tax=Acaulospora morrowiae TaxID=94023 RepID=A0A9N8W7Q6_9GLOM|nr:340_t:CDS:2 [Acaulospora morrowiae]
MSGRIDHFGWLEDAIKEGHINSFDYTQFSIVKEAGRGGFAIVECAESELLERKVALKSLRTDVSQLNEISFQEFLRETKLLTDLNHPNVNKFYGITRRDPERKMYMLVLQYANKGNLRNHLASHKDSLGWEDKRQISLDIAEGIRYLHSKNIIHRDLHSKNVLVHNNRMMIADFGLSKCLDESTMTSNSNVKGMPGYIDPQCFLTYGFKRNKKSDIFSYGIILWEVSSCKIPSQFFNPYLLPLNPIEGTPRNFIELYKRCQNITPDERPNIEEIVSILTDPYFLKVYGDNSEKLLSQDRSITNSYSKDSMSMIDESCVVLDTRQKDIQINKSTYSTIDEIYIQILLFKSCGMRPKNGSE